MNLSPDLLGSRTRARRFRADNGEVDNTGDLALLLKSRYPLIIAETSDEKRFVGILRKAAEEAGLPVWFWSSTRGLARDGQPAQYDTFEPQKALGLIGELREEGVFVLADAHHALVDPLVVRMVKEISQWEVTNKTLVLTGPRGVIPPELRGLALPWALKPPSKEEIEELVKRTLADLEAREFPISISEGETQTLIEALRGLSLTEAEQLIQQAAIRDGMLDSSDIPFVRGAKAEILEVNGCLELIEADHGTLDQVGGMHELKKWLSVRGRALEPEAARFGLDHPRGVLVTGVPGCGKSLAAKTLARTWGVPLVLLDPARLYGSYVGESEQRLHESLTTIEAMSPVVLWIDEIEKGFAAGGEGDAGVSRRILGSFLRWMQDRPPGVFLVATCNDVKSLPPELLRKGRFDDIFFVDLPAEQERKEIFRLHLSKRNRDPAGFDLDSLAGASDGFSGAEVEAAIVSALYRAYAEGQEVSQQHLVAEIEATTPLSQTRAEDVARLRDWAKGRARTA